MRVELRDIVCQTLLADGRTRAVPQALLAGGRGETRVLFLDLRGGCG